MNKKDFKIFKEYWIERERLLEWIDKKYSYIYGTNQRYNSSNTNQMIRLLEEFKQFIKGK